MKKVWIEPLAIGNIDGPRVWILVRQVGRHKDIEEMPDDVTREQDAIEYAVRKWKASRATVEVKPVQVIDIEQETTS